MNGGTNRMLSLMLGVSVPLWAGSRQFAMRRETAAMREMAEADLAAMEADTRGRVGELSDQVLVRGPQQVGPPAAPPMPRWPPSRLPSRHTAPGRWIS